MRRSTTYIIGFAAAVCLVCSVIVSGAAVSLKDRQEANKVLDRQKKVLGVAGLMKEGEELKPAEVTQLFKDKIVPRVVTLKTGEYADGVDATTFDQRKMRSDPATSTKAPPNDAKVLRVPNNALVYHVMEGEKVKLLILPIEGKGLWSTLYGYLAVQPDLNTISGITFYEHAETPGLGGEVDNPRWKSLWPGRKIYGPEGDTVKIEVIKGQAGPVESDPNRVDGLSGATITSRGVTYLVRFWLGENGFGPYLKNFKTTQGKGA
ncbi:MAG: Na(+)-translocating NADH-quinone reductase subunit C [Myxococcales bacterium]|nr:Na(+)-translocating NADH-quinone reductase subunit C [Myxococcales bacterium]